MTYMVKIPKEDYGVMLLCSSTQTVGEWEYRIEADSDTDDIELNVYFNITQATQIEEEGYFNGYSSGFQVYMTGNSEDGFYSIIYVYQSDDNQCTRLWDDMVEFGSDVFTDGLTMKLVTEEDGSGEIFANDVSLGTFTDFGVPESTSSVVMNIYDSLQNYDIYLDYIRTYGQSGAGGFITLCGGGGGGE